MSFEKIPTVPTSDEVLDRALRRAAAKMREKNNKKRADEEFIQTVYLSVHDKLVGVIQSFPTLSDEPEFYQEIVEILWTTDKLKKSLGAVGWAARWAKDHRGGFAKNVRYSVEKEALAARKKAVARLCSVVHQIEDDLLFLNEVRNVLRKLPVIEDIFTIVVAGFPNVGKSSFIRHVSSAEPEIAVYPFTTKGVIVGHSYVGRQKIQLIDTPGILDRPGIDRNQIERQALSAIIHIADVVLFILDPSAYCGYPIEEQMHLLKEVRELVGVPVVVAANKSDVLSIPGYLSMSTIDGTGVQEVMSELLVYNQNSGLKNKADPEISSDF